MSTRTRSRLRLVPLEDRVTPAAFTVSSFADDESPGTLRFALAQVNADLSPDADTVTFAAAGTLTLNGTPLEVSRPTGSVAISGGGYAVTLNGAGATRVLEVGPAATVALDGLTVTGGNGAGEYLPGFGGGILNSGTLSVDLVTVTDSAADFGGGVCNLGTLTVSASTFAGNTAVTAGGGLYNAAGAATVAASTFAADSAPAGGGVYNGPGVLTVSLSTFAGLTADFGAGVYSLGDFELVGSTLSQNAATYAGGGVYNARGILTVGGSIVSGNRVTDPDGAGPDAGGDGVTTNLGYNLFGTAVAGSVGTDVRSDAPLLAPLGDYGGPTATTPLLPGSPALDAGDPADMDADQRGVGVANGRRDIGAFESRGFALVVAGGSGQSAAIGTTFYAPLVVAVTANAPGEPVAGGVVTFAGPAAGPTATLSIPAALDATGQTSVTATANGAAGSYQVTATAAGAAALAVFALTNTSATAVAVAVSPESLTFGPTDQSVAVTATLTAPGGVVPGGTVTFTVTGPAGVVGVPTTALVSGGVASTVVTLPGGSPAGAYTVTAAYSGADAFRGGSGTATITVVPQATTTVVSAPTVTFGQTAVVTVRVTPAGAGTPTGVVRLTVDGGPERTAILSDGAATFDLGPLPAGSYALLADYPGDGNFAPSGPAAGTLVVAPAEPPPPAGQTITFAPVGPLTYGTAPVTLTAASSSGLPVAFTVVSGPGVVAGGQLTVTGAGEIVIEATQAGDETFSPAAPTRLTVAVGKAVLTVTAADATRPAGAANPAFTATYAGFVNGDTVAVLSGSPALTSTAGPASVPGSYSIIAGPGTLAAANYTFAFAPGTLTVTPAVSPPPVRYVAAAAGSGPGEVVVYDAAGAEVRRFRAFEDGFTGGARVATADVTGDGVDDVVVGAGPGGAAVVKVYDGATGGLFAAFTAFEPGYTGGVYVSAGDLTGDGRADVVVTPDEGGGPAVVVYDGAGLAAGANAGAERLRFYGIDDPDFRGGARAAVGDLDGDGFADLVVAAGFGGGPRVALFDGRSVGAAAPVRLVPDFFAFESTLRNGAFVAARDGSLTVAFGGGPSGGPRVRVFDAAGLVAAAPFTSVDAASAAELADFFAGDPSLRGGARVALADADGHGAADLFVGSGAGEPSRVRVYRSSTYRAGATPAADREVDPFGLTLAGGVYVG